MSMAPVITTERLVLRAHVPSDLSHCLAMWEHPEFYRMIGGRALTEEEVWLRLLQYWGCWATLGYGVWLIEERSTGHFVGEVGVRDLKRATVPTFAGEPEVSWGLVPAFHGRGLAREAITAVLEWCKNLPVTRLVCIINPENTRSIRLAEGQGFSWEQEVTYKGGQMALFSRPRG